MSDAPSDQLNIWREDFTEWAVRSAENFAKWLGEMVALAIRDPQSVAIVLVAGLVASAAAVVLLRAILRRIFRRSSDKDGDDDPDNYPDEDDDTTEKTTVI